MARRRCENERSYTAATAEDTRSGTNKKELELEVYSEGFIYKWYYDGCVNLRSVWGVCGMYQAAESASCWALKRFYMFLVITQFCVLFFSVLWLYFFSKNAEKAVATNWPLTI